MNPKISILVDLVLGIALASLLTLGAGCPIADSITAGLALMIVLALIDMKKSQV